MPLLERLRLGDHLCLTVDDEVVRRQSLAEAAQTGLREGHRVLFCGDGDVLGPGAGEALAAGDLKVPPISSSYFTTGAFDPAAALSFLRREVEDASHAGYPGLRLLTDMAWAGDLGPGLDGLPEFEAAANTIFAEGYALAVCAYDPRSFDRATRRGLAQAHLGTMTAEEPFDPDSVLRVRPTRQPFGLRLAGEADLLNQSALRAVLDHLLDTLPSEEPAATVDLSGLRFVDTAAARILLLASRRAEGRLRLVGQHTALARLLERTAPVKLPAPPEQEPPSESRGTS